MSSDKNDFLKATGAIVGIKIINDLQTIKENSQKQLKLAEDANHQQEKLNKEQSEFAHSAFEADLLIKRAGLESQNRAYRQEMTDKAEAADLSPVATCVLTRFFSTDDHIMSFKRAADRLHGIAKDEGLAFISLSQDPKQKYLSTFVSETKGEIKEADCLTAVVNALQQCLSDFDLTFSGVLEKEMNIFREKYHQLAEEHNKERKKVADRIKAKYESERSGKYPTGKISTQIDSLSKQVKNFENTPLVITAFLLFGAGVVVGLIKHDNKMAAISGCLVVGIIYQILILDRKRARILQLKKELAMTIERSKQTIDPDEIDKQVNDYIFRKKVGKLTAIEKAVEELEGGGFDYVSANKIAVKVVNCKSSKDLENLRNQKMIELRSSQGSKQLEIAALIDVLNERIQITLEDELAESERILEKYKRMG